MQQTQLLYHRSADDNDPASIAARAPAEPHLSGDLLTLRRQALLFWQLVQILGTENRRLREQLTGDRA